MNQPAPNNDIPTLPQPGKVIPTAEVISLAEHAAKRADKLSDVIAGLEAGITRRAEEAAASAANAGFPATDQKAAAAKVAAKARSEVAANSEDARWGYIREVNAAAESVAVTASLFASPQAVLARAGLGTPERTNYQTQIEGAGPAEVRNMAALAVATDNKVFGAAIMAVVDRMPARQRPLSTAELADRLVGEETRQVQAAITQIKLAAQHAININREFAAGRKLPLDRIKLALNKKGA